MKRIVIFFMLVLMLGSLSAQKLSALLSYRPYCTAELNPYIEFTFLIKGNSVHYAKNDQNKFSSDVKITVDILKQENDSLVQRLNYILGSVEIDDTTNLVKDDIFDVKNVEVPAGKYFLHFSLKDMNSPDSNVVYIDMIELNFSDQYVSTSAISLYKNLKNIETPDPFFDRYGFRTEPLYNNFVNENTKVIYYAMEIYNATKIVGTDKIMYVRSYVEPEKSRWIYPETIHVKNVSTGTAKVYINQLGVDKLPTGSYNLVVEVYGADSTILTITKKAFFKHNPSLVVPVETYENIVYSGTFMDQYTDLNQMKDFVASLVPIATVPEKEFIKNNLNTSKIEVLKKFFYGFWMKRNNINPQSDWQKYDHQVQLVNKQYGNSFIKGYSTDRGRVYLQYGSPNTTYDSPYDSHSYPYEIWHYYQIQDQSNIKFIFYNVDMVSNNYELLHSDMRGEIQDPFWKVKLSTRKTPIYNFDNKNVEDYWGSSADEDWNYFK